MGCAVSVSSVSASSAARTPEQKAAMAEIAALGLGETVDALYPMASQEREREQQATAVEATARESGGGMEAELEDMGMSAEAARQYATRLALECCSVEAFRELSLEQLKEDVGMRPEHVELVRTSRGGDHEAAAAAAAAAGANQVANQGEEVVGSTEKEAQARPARSASSGGSRSSLMTLLARLEAIEGLEGLDGEVVRAAIVASCPRLSVKRCAAAGGSGGGAGRERSVDIEEEEAAPNSVRLLLDGEGRFLRLETSRQLV
jgi:hypothetical protein